MATAFAERERTDRDLEGDVEIVTGGTHPADAVHDVVVRIMNERDIDLSHRTPREIQTTELQTCDIVATMGCSTLELESDADVRDWALEDPAGADADEARRIRDTIERRVEALFDEIETSIRNR